MKVLKPLDRVIDFNMPTIIVGILKFISRTYYNVNCSGQENCLIYKTFCQYCDSS